MTIESIESIEGVEKGKSGSNPDKIKWDYKLRNIILVALSLMFFVNVQEKSSKLRSVSIPEKVLTRVEKKQAEA